MGWERALWRRVFRDSSNEDCMVLAWLRAKAAWKLDWNAVRKRMPLPEKDTEPGKKIQNRGKRYRTGQKDTELGKKIQNRARTMHGLNLDAEKYSGLTTDLTSSFCSKLVLKEKRQENDMVVAIVIHAGPRVTL
jgi:hypothetical protein